MKLSKTNSFDNCETGIDNYEDNEENIQLDISEPVPEEKPKRTAKKVKISEVEMIQGTKVPSDAPPLREGFARETVGCPALKVKKPLSEKQKQNWEKCVAAREANRLKRKAEREETEKQRQADLDAKIILKAQRIKKSQERVLGPIDELKEEPEKKEEKKEIPIKKQRKIKKKIVVYDDTTTDAGSDSEDDTEFEEQHVKKQLPEIPAAPSQPTVRRVVNFI